MLAYTRTIPPTILILFLLGFSSLKSGVELELDPDSVLDLESMKPKGKWYETMVPDTLDLARRAALSVNVLTNNIEPEQYYGVYLGFRYTEDPPQRIELTWNITPKNTRTLPMLRAMSGSHYNLDVEHKMMRALMGQIRKDGQVYYPFDGAGPPKGTSYPQTNALVAFSMINFWARDGNPDWLEWIDLVARGLRETAVQVENRAYFPMQSGIDPAGKWHFMHHDRPLPIPYTPPDEPTSDQQGLEGAAKSDQIRSMSALVKHFRLTGNEQSLQMARKISRFVLKPSMWEDTRELGYPGHEHGIWGGHFHNNTNALIGLLDLAVATDDEWLKQFVREGYDHARRNGVLRMGWFPAFATPKKYNRPAKWGHIMEPCCVADMVVLAVRLTDAGLGDYWDDVDSIIRNYLITQQMDRSDLMLRVSDAGAGSEGEKLMKRFVGGFCHGEPTTIWSENPYGMSGCCTVNGAQSLYYAWHGITRFNRGVATVNLFLNRASPWMDIDSYLPYQGRIALHNKQAHTALVRIPAWLGHSKIRTTLRQSEGNTPHKKPIEPVQIGNYLLFRGLQKGTTIELQFPVPEQTDQYTIAGQQYTVRFRGSTVVDITPRDSQPDKIPLFRDRSSQLGKGMRKVRRFVADKLIPLGTF